MILEPFWIRLEASSVGQRLIRGTFWSLIGTFSTRALGFVASVFAARILGKVTYGELGMIQTTVGTFGMLAGFGMGTTAARYVAELRSKDQMKAGRIIGLSSLVSWTLSIVLALALILLAPWLCNHTLGAPYLTAYLRLSAPLLVVSGINGAQIGVLTGFEAFKSIARVSFIAGLLSFPLVVGGAFLFGLAGVIGGLIAATAMGCLLNRMALRHEADSYGISISYSCLPEFPILWQFSIPALLGDILISMVNWAAASMLVRRPGGYGEMGAFNAANQWFNALMWLPYMVNGVVLPVLVERLGADDKLTAAKLLKTTIKMDAVIVLPVMVIGCLFSPVIMMTYGKGFGSEWPTLIATLLAAGIFSLEFPVVQLMTASRHMWLGFWSNVGWGIIFLVTTNFLLKWGSLGLASSRLIAYSSHGVFGLVYVFIFLAAAKRYGCIPGAASVGTLGAVVSETDVTA